MPTFRATTTGLRARPHGLHAAVRLECANLMKGEIAMRPPHIPFVAAAIALDLGLASVAIAQTRGPTSSVAPGPEAPPSGLGGIGPGRVPVAPGSATTGDTDIERIGPGGGLIAPGPDGSVSGSPLPSIPAQPTPRVR
jgi:hypothetical protein